MRIKDNLITNQSNLLLNNVKNYTFVLKNNSNSIENNDKNIRREKLEICPTIPPKLIGAIFVNNENDSFENIQKLLPEIEIGGRFRPKECIARHKVAIIIPYRDRENNLKVFLRNIHPVLERQQLDYGIYVIEQFDNNSFNKGKLMNIGFLESRKQYDYQCFIFQDVDLIPEDDRILYTCSEQPKHLAVAIDKFKYKLSYGKNFGGVCALTEEQFLKINGFSNEFLGWGGEDDDMYNRVVSSGYIIYRYSESIARYKMLKHRPSVVNPYRYEKLKSGKNRYKTDGINSVTYKRLDLVLEKLFTWIQVEV